MFLIVQILLFIYNVFLTLRLMIFKIVEAKREARECFTCVLVTTKSFYIGTKKIVEFLKAIKISARHIIFQTK